MIGLEFVRVIRASPCGSVGESVLGWDRIKVLGRVLERVEHIPGNDMKATAFDTYIYSIDALACADAAHDPTRFEFIQLDQDEFLDEVARGFYEVAGGDE